MVTYEVCDFTSLSSPSARRTFGLTPEISASSSVGDGGQHLFQNKMESEREKVVFKREESSS
jgi:hypothetical protein